jgi:CBS domain-containing membrane protein
VFGLPKAPLSQPRNILLSHPIAAGSALSVRFAIENLFVMESAVVCSALSVGLSTLLMLGFNAMHPPAGGTALIVATSTIPEIDLFLSASAGAGAIAGLSWTHKKMFGI